METKIYVYSDWDLPDSSGLPTPQLLVSAWQNKRGWLKPSDTNFISLSKRETSYQEKQL